MATLTETARITRMSIVVGIALIVLIAIGTITWQTIPASNPPPEIIPTPTPEVLYGKLPPIKFPQSSQYPSSLKLETIAGGPPVSTNSANVYFIRDKSPNLFSRNEAKEIAQKIGFAENSTEIDETTLSFSNPETGGTLTVDITNKNFIYKRSKFEASDLAELDDLSELDVKNFARIAQSYFQPLVDWNSMLIESFVSYYKLNGSSLAPANANDADFVRVDFLQSDIDGLPILTSISEQSDTYIIFSMKDNQIGIVYEASYQNFPPDEFTRSLYPTISGTQAWEKLTTGGGYIASPEGDIVTVREGSFAYFQPPGHHSYIQPVYVFEGDRGFIGIVPAIDPLWIGD